MFAHCRDSQLAEKAGRPTPRLLGSLLDCLIDIFSVACDMLMFFAFFISIVTVIIIAAIFFFFVAVVVFVIVIGVVVVVVLLLLLLAVIVVFIVLSITLSPLCVFLCVCVHMCP